MRIAIVGSREFPDLEAVSRYLYSLAQTGQRVVIVSGAARGVDAFAVRIAKQLGFQTEEMPAQWKDDKGNFDRSAGYRRNLQVVESVDKVVAFWDGRSKGTKHTIDIALAQNKDLEVIFP